MRVFIAVPIEDEARREISSKFEHLREFGAASLKLVESKNIHLTLRFLGELSEEQVEKIREKLREIKFESFVAETGEVGFFPSENYIKVIFVEFISEKVKELKMLVDKKLLESGFPLETDFVPHITVARVKAVKDRETFLNKIRGIKIKKQEFEVNKFLLMKSELTPQGPIYKVLEEFGLNS